MAPELFNDCVLFSCCLTPEERAKDLIKQILRVDNLPTGQPHIDDITSYTWNIDNKYYSATVDLCYCPKRTIGNEKFANSVQAIVLHFDADRKTSFDIVRAWIPFISLIEPSVCILACSSCNDTTELDFTTVQKWCIENSFELVELDNKDDDSDDGFGDIDGIERIRSALQAHSWPNLELKDEIGRSPYIENLLTETTDVTPAHTSSQDGVTVENDSSHTIQDSVIQSLKEVDLNADGASTPTNTNSSTATKHSEISDSFLPGDDEAALLEALGNEDPSTESFEVMFSRLKNMKEKAEKMNDNERKSYAEKVAMTFWRAVGGDESELADLSDD